MIERECSWCRVKFYIQEKEYTRQIKKGRIEFFCSRSCAAYASNLRRFHKERFIEVKCEFCGKLFIANNNTKKQRFCCRSHASAGSITERRLKAARQVGKTSSNNFTIIDIANGLRKREAWKYKKLNEWLIKKNQSFEFEYVIGNYVFDLALPDKKILIEFDGIYHSSANQVQIDSKKDNIAISEGWRVIRAYTTSGKEIEIEAIRNLSVFQLGE